MKAHVTVIGSGVNGVIHVGFRRWLAENGKANGLRVQAHNEGEQVKATIEGDTDQVIALLKACRHGPPRARVLDVRAEIERN
jgi:acylphosphatase